MKIMLQLTIAGIIALGAFGCEQTATTEKKAEVTNKAPGGETKTSVEQKTEATPSSETKTTTEKTEKSGENPPPPVKP